jgi:hypothetical protein
MKSNAKFVDPRTEQRQSDADKTARLRGLRIAKEAAEKETAEREAAEKVEAKAAEKKARQASQRRPKAITDTSPSAE